ncbi:MAG TPA: CoB--CoM heterodisulfide reductase iron-sulfur subunit B family protein [Nitrospinota bacterium]|nr:CoB--CoM heterodisulfide reductase iron-sulfur subunit B family protein [Nitrospinota bacterium]
MVNCKYALFTGCVAKGAGRELLTATEAVCEKLSIELAEMTDASCCGAGVISEDNPMAADLLNARTFALAEEQGLDIMNICITCQGVHNKTKNKLDNNPEYKAEVNLELKRISGKEYKGVVKIQHFGQVILGDSVLEKMKNMVVRPLTGLKAGAFYGCYATRPHECSDLDNPDSPDEMEKIIEALGATPVDYAARLKCCGFPIIMMNKKNSLALSGNALNSAQNAGADCLITQCPLCHLNLDAYQPEIPGEYNMPIIHIQQLVGLALGLEQNELKMNTHIVNPAGILSQFA